MATPSRVDEELSLEQLYLEYGRQLHRAALRLLGNREDAEDATQTALLQAYRAMVTGMRPDQPRAWLFAIVTNVCRGVLRKRSQRGQAARLERDLPAPESGPDRATAAEIQSTLAYLTPSQREVFILREVHGLSYAELAERVGLSASATAALLFRARAAFQEQLEALRSPLSCGEVEDLLRRRVEGAASKEEGRALRAHLRDCGACRAFYRSLLARRRWLGGLPLVSLPWGRGPRLASVTRAAHTAPATGLKLAGVLGAAAIGAGASASPAGIAEPQAPTAFAYGRAAAPHQPGPAQRVSGHAAAKPVLPLAGSGPATSASPRLAREDGVPAAGVARTHRPAAAPSPSAAGVTSQPSEDPSLTAAEVQPTSAAAESSTARVRPVRKSPTRPPSLPLPLPVPVPPASLPASPAVEVPTPVEDVLEAVEQTVSEVLSAVPALDPSAVPDPTDLIPPVPPLPPLPPIG